MMAKGKRAKLFEVGTIDINGKEIIKTMSTQGVHNTISEMNGMSKIITLVIKKKTKQTEAFDHGTAY